MADFHLFSPLSYGELGEPLLAGEQELGWPELSLNPWAQTPGAEIETEVPWVHPKCSPTGRSRRRGYIALPRESHSLTHVARRPSDRARKHRSGSLRLEEACGEAPTKSSRTWRRQQQQQQQELLVQQPQDHPGPCYPAAREGSSPQYPGEAFSPPSAGTLLVEKTHTGDRWAMPVWRRVGLWSPSSVLADKSSVHSLEFCKQSQNKSNHDRTESLNKYNRPSASCKEKNSQHAQVLKSKLDEAVISLRDQKILALVLSRLKKAQRMRELQQQAAVAWEELMRSDQKVHLTLERERKLLLLQSQEQWQGQREQHKLQRGHGHEQPRQGHKQHGSRRDRQAKSTLQLENESEWVVQADSSENRGLDRMDKVQAQAEHLKQCQAQSLREQERVLQSVRDLNRLQLSKRLEIAGHKREQHMAESPKTAQESNLSTVVNFQARKVLMDCQAKAEELLRKLSLEQSSQSSQDIHEGLVKERHREQQGKAQAEAEQFQRMRWHAEEAEELLQVSKRVLAELAEQKSSHARSHAHKTTKDRAQRLQELNILRERNHHILKLKAEKEEKCHIEGIKEAVKKKEQRLEQMIPGKDNILQEYQKGPPSSKMNRCFDQAAAEPQLPLHQQGGVY